MLASRARAGCTDGIDHRAASAAVTLLGGLQHHNVMDVHDLCDAACTGLVPRASQSTNIHGVFLLILPALSQGSVRQCRRCRSVSLLN
jgi:hypothetical protein